MIPQGSKGSINPHGKTLESFRWESQHVLNCLFLEDHCGYCGARLGRAGRGVCDGTWSRWGNGGLLLRLAYSPAQTGLAAWGTIPRAGSGGVLLLS